MRKNFIELLKRTQQRQVDAREGIEPAPHAVSSALPPSVDAAVKAPASLTAAAPVVPPGVAASATFETESASSGGSGGYGSDSGGDGLKLLSVPPGLANDDNSCYINALLRTLWLSCPLRSLLKSTPAGMDLMLVLHDTLIRMDDYDLTNLEPECFTGALRKAAAERPGCPFKVDGEQQDVAEALEVVFDISGNLFDPLFGATLENLNTCLQCRNTSGPSSDKLGQLLKVAMPKKALKRKRSAEKKSVYNLLFDDYMKEEEIDCSCSICGAQKASKSGKFSSLPKLLVVSLKRFDNDHTKNSEQVAIEPFFELSGQMYVLYAIILHLGESTTRGHFVTYGTTATEAVKDQASETAEAEWRKYNDEHVSSIMSRVDLMLELDNNDDSTTPYILWYCSATTSEGTG